jgi:acetyl esterase/lipase
VIGWARRHAREYGADPAVMFVAGTSSGGQLAALAAFTPNDPAYQPGFEHADTSVTAAICLCGYYGDPAEQEQSPFLPLAYDGAGAPPFFIAHGDHDTLIPVAAARLFARRLRATSANPVIYAELPGAQHGFDRFLRGCPPGSWQRRGRRKPGRHDHPRDSPMPLAWLRSSNGTLQCESGNAATRRSLAGTPNSCHHSREAASSLSGRCPRVIIPAVPVAWAWSRRVPARPGQ